MNKYQINISKEELMKILKPLIKECIRDVIFEEGSLSTIISEVVKSTGGQSTLRESKKHSRLESKKEDTQLYLLLYDLTYAVRGGRLPAKIKTISDLLPLCAYPITSLTCSSRQARRHLVH